MDLDLQTKNKFIQMLISGNYTCHENDYECIIDGKVYYMSYRVACIELIKYIQNYVYETTDLETFLNRGEK